MTKSASERAESFLRDSVQFRLGPLVTEAAHPRSTELSQTARRDVAEGLGVLFDVDRDVVEAYARWSASGQPEALRDMALAALRGGGRLFFTGCGATGRLSIQLAATWRAFWQERRAAGLLTPDPDAWEDRAFSAMAGGDYALIKSVEGFEDFAPFGRRQLADLGVAKGDAVFAITEGGETSFVIGTAWQGLEAGARVAFVYNNPDAVLRERVERSRAVIDEPRITKVNLTTGPMAITGSTRMQATSSELLAMLTVLEMVLRDVLARDGAAPAGLAPSAAVPAQMREGLATLHAELSSERLRKDLARLVCAEEAVYLAGARTSYFADALAVDVLTDTTERSPTFCTPAFRKWDDTEAAESWAFLFTPEPTSERAWTRLLRRAPQTIEWTGDDLRRLLDAETAERQEAVLGEIRLSELLRFRIGQDGLPVRPRRPGDGATAVVTRATARCSSRGLLRGTAGGGAGERRRGGARRRGPEGRAGTAPGDRRLARGGVAVRRADGPRHAVPARPARARRREDAAERALHLHDGAPGPRAREPDDLGRPEQPQARRPLDALHRRPGRRLVRPGLPRALRGDRLRRAAAARRQGVPGPGGRRDDAAAPRAEPARR